MKKILLFVAVAFQTLISYGQEIKSLNPTYVYLLDFSNKAKEEWTQRDTLLSQLSDGRKDWNEMTKEEEALIQKYGEVYEDIWDIVGGGCSWYCGGGPEKVTASSYLKSQGSNNYEAKNAHDLNYKNAWVEFFYNHIYIFRHLFDFF